MVRAIQLHGVLMRLASIMVTVIVFPSPKELEYRAIERRAPSRFFRALFTQPDQAGHTPAATIAPIGEKP